MSASIEISVEENNAGENYAFSFLLEPGIEVRCEAIMDEEDWGNPGIVMDISFEGPMGGSGPLMLFNATIEGEYDDPTEKWTLFQITMQVGINETGGGGEWAYDRDNIDTPLDELGEPAIARVTREAWDKAQPKVSEWWLQQKQTP